MTEGPWSVTVYVSEALLGAVMAAWLVMRGRAAIRDRRLRPVLIGAGAVLTSLALSCLAAAEPGAACRACLRWVEFLGVLVIAADGALRGVYTRRLLVGTIGAGTVIMAAHALLDARPWLVRVDDLPDRAGLRVGAGEVVWRATGFTHPGALAAILATGAAVCAAEAVSASRMPTACFAGAAAALTAATIVLTYARGGLLWLAAIAVALGAAALRAPRPRAVLLRIAALTAVTALLVRGLSLPQALAAQTAAVRGTAARLTDWLASSVQSTAVPLGTESAQSDLAVRGVDSRKQMAEAVGRLVAGHPLAGVGPGQYRRSIRAVAGEDLDPAGLAHHPHNLYLLVLAEQGAVGLLAWGILMLGLLRMSSNLHRHGWPEAAWAGAWSGLLAGFLLHSAFDVLVIHARGIPIAFLLGALLKAPGAGMRERNGRSPRPPTRA